MIDFGIEKCAMVVRIKGKEMTKEIEQPNEESIKMIGEKRKKKKTTNNRGH